MMIAFIKHIYFQLLRLTSYRGLLLTGLGMIGFLGISPVWASDNLSERIHHLHDQILAEQKTTQQLSEADLASLPVGVTNSIGGIEYLIIIDSARFTPKGAFFDAYISLPFKSDGKRIAFAARNIAFHRGGIAASTEVRLSLVTDHTLNFGPKTKITLPTLGNQNYVAIDCNGFKSVNLQGKITFDRELLIPEDEQGEALPGEVETDFRVNSSDWNSLMITLSLPTFRLPSLQGVNFNVQEAILDMSDLINPIGMRFPTQYQQEYGDNAQLWEGMYIRRASVGLFKELSEDGKRRYIDVEDFIIDKQGVTGSIGVNRIFGRDEGSLNGWPFSVDSLGIIWVRNQLSGAEFRGQINIPLLSRDHPLSYSAFVTQEAEETEYTFALQPGKHLEASVLAAEIDLFPSSTIIVSKHQGKLLPEAILHGSISIRSGDELQLNNINFTDLHIASEKPYIRNGYWSLNSKQANTAGNYPISIDSISFAHNDQQVQLNVAAMLGLMDAADKGFSARSLIRVEGEIIQSEIIQSDTTATESETAVIPSQEWKYKETHIGDIAINADMSAFQLQGQLSFYKQHAVYGQGFRGEVEASFTAGPTVRAIAQFGRVEDYRYWYADAMVNLGNSAATPGFAVYGFGGGAYYHMALERNSISAGNFHTVQGELDRTSIGATRSGSRYVPDKSVQLGVKASALVGTAPSPRPFNGDATFEMAFNQRMGLKYIRFRGEGYFLTGLDERNTQPPMYADLNINYDFDNRELNAFLDMYVDAYDVIRGVNANAHAGSAVMHFGEESWYVWIGTPSQRIGVNVMGLAETNAYLMVGDKIESMPPPLDGMQISAANLEEVMAELTENAARTGGAATGRGFVFGASFNTAIGKDDPGNVFYGFFRAGAGFDMMLQDRGSVSCTGSTEPIGINGWYASGQAWAYLQGAVGINVNLKFIKGKFEAFRFLGAVVMQAELPNPTWVQGTVFGEFNILNGLVKGDCHFQVTMGEPCELEGDTPITLKVIADMQPDSGSDEVDVFTLPQVAFNIAVETPIEMLTADEQYESYRVKLTHFKIMDNTTEVAGVLSWNEDKTVVAFRSDEILPPQRKLKAEVKLTWQKLVSGSWTDLDATETREVAFTTGTAPDYIPAHNIAYSYPVRNQYSFLPDEYGTGYIRLVRGQSYLFETEDAQGRSWTFEARFNRPRLPAFIDNPLTYRDKTITFSIPDDLAQEAVYQLTLLKKPLRVRLIDENVVQVEREVTLAQAGTLTTTEKNIQGSLAMPEEETLFSYGFRTSLYDNFSDKVDAMFGQQTTSGIVQDILIYKVGTRFSMLEVFDATELNESYGQPALISAYATTDNPWFSDYMYPLLYEYYPVDERVRIDWRTPQTVSVPPIYSIVSHLTSDAPSLTSEQQASGNATRVSGPIYFNYQMPTYTYKDHRDLRPKAINRYVGVSMDKIPSGALRLINNSYQNFLDGDYDFVLEYRLPGTHQVSSTKTLSITW